MRTDRLGKETWELDPDDIIDLRHKLSHAGVALKKCTDGRIYRGVLTGLSDVFLLSREKRDQLLREDPKCADLLRPFAQGTNLRPWYMEDSGNYLLGIKSSSDHIWPWSNSGADAEQVFRGAYPAIYGYLDGFRESAIARADQGRFWWELRSCSYWQAFDETKIVWPDITNRPRFSMDQHRRCLGNTGYIVPGGDFFLLGVLASWATWFFISKTAQPLRLRSDRWQYRLFAQFMEKVPIPAPPETDRRIIVRLAEGCNSLGIQRYQVEAHVRARLIEAFGFDEKGRSLGKLNERAQEWWGQSQQRLGAALKQSFKLARNPFARPSTADEWDSYLKEKNAEVDSLHRKLAEAEAEINDRVYKSFALTPDEITLLKREVEH